MHRASIVPESALDEATATSVVSSLSEALPRFGPRPFETLAGEFEAQPFQFVGPLEEFPQVAPVRYLLLTHWDDARGLTTWLKSAEMAALGDLGKVSTDVHVQIRHQPGERQHLNAAQLVVVNAKSRSFAASGEELPELGWCPGAGVRATWGTSSGRGERPRSACCGPSRLSSTRMAGSAPCRHPAADPAHWHLRFSP